MIRDKKISVLLSVSFLLLLASFLILCIWGYNFYMQVKEEKEFTGTDRNPTPDPAAIRDSLLTIYTSSIRSLENQLGNTYTASDSLENDLRVRLDDYYRLKAEVAAMLSNPQTAEDFRLAGSKIRELQARINSLTRTNIDVQEENRRLHALLQQMNDKPVSMPAVYRNETPTHGAPREPRVPVCNDVQLESYGGTDDAQAGIAGSFVLKHPEDIINGEAIIVVTQPDGSVLQKSAWEAGSFQTGEGRKIYSCKVKFDYTRGESRRLTFNIPAENLQNGSYGLQVYYNGSRIGRATASF